MQMKTLYSPDGTSTVQAHPSAVESMMNKGWAASPFKKKAVKATSPDVPVEDSIQSAPSEDSAKE